MIGQKLLQLRKRKHLSQEEVAEKLNVSRQTISKWETDQSTPDFDKIVPLCELYEISANELFMEKIDNKEKVVTIENNNGKKAKVVTIENNNSKKAKGIAQGVFLYFCALAWVMITIPVMKMNPIVSSAIFLLICGIGTYLIVYTCIIYKEKKEKQEEPKLLKQINMIISLIITVIYFWISFTTMAWHITWIIWVVCGLLQEIVNLIFMLKEENNEK